MDCRYQLAQTKALLMYQLIRAYHLVKLSCGIIKAPLQSSQIEVVTTHQLVRQTVKAGKTRSFMDSTRMLVVVGNLKYMMKKSVAWYVKPATQATVIRSRIRNSGSSSLPPDVGDKVVAGAHAPRQYYLMDFLLRHISISVTVA